MPTHKFLFILGFTLYSCGNSSSDNKATNNDEGHSHNSDAITNQAISADPNNPFVGKWQLACYPAEDDGKSVSVFLAVKQDSMDMVTRTFDSENCSSESEIDYILASQPYTRIEESQVPQGYTAFELSDPHYMELQVRSTGLLFLYNMQPPCGQTLESGSFYRFTLNENGCDKIFSAKSSEEEVSVMRIEGNSLYMGEFDLKPEGDEDDIEDRVDIEYKLDRVH